MLVNLLQDELDISKQDKKPALVNLLADEMSQKENNSETFQNALARAPGKVLEDVTKGLYNFGTKTIPETYSMAYQESPHVREVLKEHPIHALGQGLAGLAEWGTGALNKPKDMADYLADRLHLISKEKAEKVPNLQSMYSNNISNAINEMLGEPKYPGEELLRFAGRNAVNIFGGTKAAMKANPLQLTSSNIAKKISKEGEKKYLEYAGPSGKYEKLSQEATQRGINGQHINPSKNDLDILKQHMPEDEYLAIDKLMQNKNLTNAQNAISQLGHRERKLKLKSDRGDVLNDAEKDLLKSVKNTKSNIQENMFKDQSGEIHQDLLEKHHDIQKGYATEVIPYTKNNALQKYNKGKKLADELVSSLSKGEFAAMRGHAHPSLMIRRALGKYGIPITLGGSAGLLGKKLFDYMNQ